MSPSITRTQKEKKKNKVDSSRIVTSQITAPPTPKGFQPFTETLENETFNWNNIEKDSNLELWAVRIPRSLDPKRLDGLTIALPSSLPADSPVPLAQFEAGRSPTRMYEVKMSSENAGGAEMSEVSCLLPRDDGYLGLASKPITTHLLVSETYVLPTPATTQNPSQPGFSSEISPLPLPSSQRYAHPEHLLKGRFIPTGAIPLGSKPKVFEPLEEVEDSETSVEEGPTKRAAATRRKDIGVAVPTSISPAKRMTATPVVPVKNPRKRKKEPVVGGDGKAPKKRKRNE